MQYRIRVSTNPDMTVPQSESSGFFMFSSLLYARGLNPPLQYKTRLEWQAPNCLPLSLSPQPAIHAGKGKGLREEALWV